MHDSPSDRAIVIGCQSGNVISFGVLAKKCAKCARVARFGLDVYPPHICTINHEGTSGSMEAKLVLQLTVEMYENNSDKNNLQKIGE